MLREKLQSGKFLPSVEGLSRPRQVLAIRSQVSWQGLQPCLIWACCFPCQVWPLLWAFWEGQASLCRFRVPFNKARSKESHRYQLLPDLC